jgi:malate permease and related proteins
MDLNALLATFANNLLPILALSAAGFFLGKALSIDSRALGRVVFYIFSPILVFNLLLHVELRSDEILGTMAYCFLVSAAGVLLAFGLGRLLRLERPILMALIITVAFGNTGNFGLPVVSFAFGPEALAYASLYFVTTSILFNTAGVLIASLGHMDFKTAIWGLFKVPSVYGVILAALLNRFDIALPLPLQRTIDLAAGGSIPLMIVLLGIELSRVVWSHSTKPIAMSVGLRLLVGPIIGLLLAIPFGLEGAARQGSITQTAMPAAVTNTVLATEYGLDSSLVTAMVFLGTVLSPLTLTPLLVLLGQ